MLVTDQLFLKEKSGGGIHHVCYEVDDISEAANFAGKGAKILEWQTKNRGARETRSFYIKEFLELLGIRAGRTQMKLHPV